MIFATENLLLEVPKGRVGAPRQKLETTKRRKRTSCHLCIFSPSLTAVVLCFIGISGPKKSEERVAMRVSQGGHDVHPKNWCPDFPGL